jgi:succinate dehydrogenase / fumarate reductase cytochrome b subunit
MARNPGRPLSPHLTIWKWGPHMLVSILHRITGVGLATVGVVGFVWWLVAAASGAEAYDQFLAVARSWFGVLVGVGLTWSLFQHTFSGIRHFVLDMGAGYELRTNKIWAVMTLVGAVLATLLVWALILGNK